MKSREQTVTESLLKFFEKESNFKIFLDIVIFKNKNIPLRLLDWFITNYSKKNDICYNIKKPSGVLENFCVYRSYRAQLKGCNKKEFDPFCRGNTITLEYVSPIDNSKVVFETAICQLKFFRWGIENLVLNYVEANYDAIYADMKEYSSKSQKVPIVEEPKEKRRKNELSKSIFQQMHVSSQQVTVSFGGAKPPHTPL